MNSVHDTFEGINHVDGYGSKSWYLQNVSIEQKYMTRQDIWSKFSTLILTPQKIARCFCHPVEVGDAFSQGGAEMKEISHQGC